jgi:FtsP/CotA-like multicopper oxidase with cupredoxin domain
VKAQCRNLLLLHIKQLRKAFLLFAAFLWFCKLQASVVSASLYINRGSFTTVSGSTFPALAYNSTISFNALNTVIRLLPGDTLQLKIVNRDSVMHGFSVLGLGYAASLNPYDSAIRSICIKTEGVWIYYDQLDYPSKRYLGLGGMICVSKKLHPEYFWNIKEHETGFNHALTAGGNVSWTNYKPDYFTINGKSFPDLQNDSSARVKAQTGDSVYIYLVNTGQSTHSIHFHGFHTTAVYASDKVQQGRTKDTWRVRSMDALVLLLVPDKKGQYSVHDHNLAAVSGGGIHPNGMFLIMEIE